MPRLSLLRTAVAEPGGPADDLVAWLDAEDVPDGAPFLISPGLGGGAFRVHRADCRDCEKEARRSDSAGNAEEYASRAEVVAGLWSDISAENPGLYGTP
jgi:hypothetical protein